MLLAQAVDSFWAAEAGTTAVWRNAGIAFVVGMALLVAVLYAPTRARRFIVGAFTFLAGLYWVLYWLVPTPVNRQPDDLPANLTESAAFWLEDANPIVGSLANILLAFLLGLGIYSLLRIHSARLFKQQKDWFFSLVLLISLVAMTIYGYIDWYQREQDPLLAARANWGHFQYGLDFLFDGLLQEMDAGMFSIIAFFILSAAYRAFRIRSVEATILLATAFIVMLSFLGMLTFALGTFIDDNLTKGDQSSIWNNLKLENIYFWIKNTIQTPSIRALEFGIGLGALAMGLRLWLSLERGGVRS